MREVHTLAIFVHGVLAAMHGLGVVYNVRKGNRWQTYCHVGGLIFSSHAVWHHHKEAHK